MPITLVDTTPHELIVVKPANLASEHTRDPQADSLVHRLGQQGFTDLRCVHRLDSPACGLMLIARTAAAAKHYSAEIEARREAVNEFWDSLGLTAADALRAARRLISRGARFPAPPPARGCGPQQA